MRGVWRRRRGCACSTRSTSTAIRARTRRSTTCLISISEMSTWATTCASGSVGLSKLRAAMRRPPRGPEDEGDGSLSMEIAAWLQGVGTVAAVVVALFLEVFLVWWRRPRFTLEVSLDPQQKDLVSATRAERDHHVCWLRGRIFVADGKKPALNAEVVVQDWLSPADQDVPFAHGTSLR